MQRYEITDLGPVPTMTTNRVGPLMPRVPKMRSNPPAKMEPIVSVTLQKPVLAKKPIPKTVKIMEHEPKERLIELPPPILKKKVKPKATAVSLTTPIKRSQNKREPPTKFTGKETVRLKPVPKAIPTAPAGVVKESINQKKYTKSLAPPKVRWR